MGTRFLAVALAAAFVWYAWHWHSSPLSVWAMALHILIWSFVAATIGKVVGILVFRRRAKRASAR